MHRARARLAIVAAVGLAAATLSAVSWSPPATAAPEVDCGWAEADDGSLSQAFDRAAEASGVPADVLKAVGFLGSRWEDHGAAASADGGYGPMHLTDLDGARRQAQRQAHESGRGDGSVRTGEQDRTALLGAELTGLPLRKVKAHAPANVCAAAAVLASYQSAQWQTLDDWADPVARLGGAEFTNLVFASLRSGETRRTSAGERIRLRAHRGVTAEPFPATAKGLDCPRSITCEWIKAPYAKASPDLPDDTGDYGNHDLADRTGPGGPKLRYIVIHNTEGSYDGSIAMVQDPTYLAWNYTLRSWDGHVAQHLRAKNVGWHAGNWYVNMHSIGLEHEGKAGNGGWFTEAMLVRSAQLTKYLARKYDIPLDPGHIIGHDEIPGTVPGATTSVHWDPGPYFDWQHYFELLGIPVGGGRPPATKVRPGDVVTVRPGFGTNPHPQITDCEEQSPGSGTCVPGAGTNFVPLYRQPSRNAALATDIGEHPDGAASTWRVDDHSARATAGQRLVVSGTHGRWVQVSWAGESAWLHNPRATPVLVTAKAPTIRAKRVSAPVYGRAYPEAEAYPDDVPVQELAPLEYTIKPGQAYVVLDRRPVTDYYHAKTFDGSGPGDRTVVRGKDRYYQIELGHRFFFVRAADVVLRR